MGTILAFGDPTKPIGPIYLKEEADRLAGEKAGCSSRTATASAGSCAVSVAEEDLRVAAWSGSSTVAASSSVPAAAASRSCTPTRLCPAVTVGVEA